jgi:hypothetical protein
MKISLCRFGTYVGRLVGAFCLAAWSVWSGPVSPTAGPLAQTLSGGWRLALDPGNQGRAGRWFEEIPAAAQPAPVPGMIQQVFPGDHGVAWYWREFTPELARRSGDRVLLGFGAVDYLADVWVNGKHVGAYEGGETPFELDITAALNALGANLLAVRVLNPTDKPIEGIVLGQTPHRNKVMAFSCGSMLNSGGILYPVTLKTVPAVYVAGLFAQPEPQTGRLRVKIEARNANPVAVMGELEVSVAPAAGGGETLQSVGNQAVFPSGWSAHELEIQVPSPRLWNLEDPYLYRVTAALTTTAAPAHRQSTRCGFRDFRLVDGFFQLNGKRLFLKSTHTGNCLPITQQTIPSADFARRDLFYAKASGFNTVRFIAGLASPEQLDLCDELGLMVYEECFASWLLGDSPLMGARFDASTAAMIRRDRNHPSVTIWGLLNETQDGPVFRHALAYLPALRALDPARLVLLGSGRWDGQMKFGSASNPGGGVWEHVWGGEGPGAASASLGAGGYVPGAGDAHFYPATPQAPESTGLIRALGQAGKPVFLSEYGIGSEMNVLSEWRHFQQAGARPDLEDATIIREQAEAFTADWTRLGFDGVYPFPEDFLRESQRLHARQRTLGFNAIRSNPRICGFNLTGMLDHAITGEGLWTFWREWKPEVFDAVSDGWAPLRWCLFAEPMNLFPGQPITVEAVLATEDALAPGDYPARFRVLGAHGVVWEKSARVQIPNPPPLAVPVIRETFQFEAPPGAYSFAASLDQGGAPAGGRLRFFVSEPVAFPVLSGEASLWGLDAKVEKWLSARGLVCAPLATNSVAPIILVGNPADAEQRPELWETLSRRLTGGATVVFLSGQLFQSGQAAMAWLPLKAKGRCRDFNDWLYHKECVAKTHPVFDGLPGPGILDWDYYGPVIPRAVWEGLDTPDETVAAAFATGNAQYPRGYGSGLLIARYHSGSGNLILSTPRILEHLAAHPAADRLLVNLVRYAQSETAK